MEDQVGQKRCGHRPGKEVVSKAEMVDRIKAAVDAKTDANFVLMARTDAAARSEDRWADRVGRLVSALTRSVTHETLSPSAVRSGCDS
jgi:2-methylisocitrate lyase-like PEP mutase family enzyme